MQFAIRAFVIACGVALVIAAVAASREVMRQQRECDRSGGVMVRIDNGARKCANVVRRPMT
jgi:phage-related baseplate assembly protein